MPPDLPKFPVGSWLHRYVFATRLCREAPTLWPAFGQSLLGEARRAVEAHDSR